MRDFDRRCPVCDEVVRHSHTCHATRLAYPPLEGEEAVEAARRVKAALLAAKHPEQVPTRPYQPSMTFGSGGL